jgi:hypothetical protein
MRISPAAPCTFASDFTLKGVKMVSVGCHPGKVDDERKGRGYECKCISKQGEFGVLEAIPEGTPGRAYCIPLLYCNL